MQAITFLGRALTVATLLTLLLPSACGVADSDCSDACTLVNEARPNVSTAVCEDRCVQSNPAVNSGGIRCLALRVFWIDEEPDRVGPTWDNFDDNDDCTGPGPDSEGYGPF